MRLIIEWLDKDGNVLFRKDQLPTIGFGGTVTVTPVIPEVKTEINLPGFPTIKGIMDDAANKYIDVQVELVWFGEVWTPFIIVWDEWRVN